MDYDALFASGNVYDVCEAVALHVRGARTHANFMRGMYEYCCKVFLQNGNGYCAEFLLRRAKMWARSSDQSSRAALLEMAVFVTVARASSPFPADPKEPSESKRMTTKQTDACIAEAVSAISRGEAMHVHWPLFRKCVQRRWATLGDQQWSTTLAHQPSVRTVFARTAHRLYRVMHPYKISATAAADLWYAATRSLAREPLYQNVYPPVAMQCALKAEYLYHEHGVSNVRDRVYLACLGHMPPKESAETRRPAPKHSEECRVLTIEESSFSEKKNPE